MPLTAKGEKIKAAMQQEYGEKKGEEVFYASKNAGKISGVDDMNGGVEGLKSYGDTMSEGSEGLKSYEAAHDDNDDDTHHHELKGKTGPDIEDDKKKRDAGMGLVHAKEEKEASHAEYPKPMDSRDGQGFTFPRTFPNDPFGDTNPQGGFEWEEVWSASAQRKSPFSIYKE
jgi:hypothetical protein